MKELPEISKLPTGTVGLENETGENINGQHNSSQLEELPEISKLPTGTVESENETIKNVVKSNDVISENINEQHMIGKRNLKLKEYEKIYKKIQDLYETKHISISAACERCKISTAKYYVVCKELGKKSFFMFFLSNSTSIFFSVIFDGATYLFHISREYRNNGL